MTHDPYHHDYDNPTQQRTIQATGTTKAHDQNEEDTGDEDEQDDDTLLILS